MEKLNLSTVQLKAFFEIDATVSWIKQHGFHRVALQFPDYFLPFSAQIALQLEKECESGVKTYILADTTYRSCCVDLVAADQCCADSIIHYGDSCMSETNTRIPIRFVYGSMPVNYEELKKAIEQFKDRFEERCCLLYDAIYANSSDTLCDVVRKIIGPKTLFHCNFICRLRNAELSKTSNSDGESCLGRQVPKEKDNMTVLFIGESNSPLLPLWLMTNLNCTNVLIFSPSTSRFSFERTSATCLLRKRLFLIEKLRDAHTVGLIVNTLDLVGYKEIVDRTRQLCKVAGKRSYTLAMGKINVPKLSNFANDIEAFIVLSCPYGVIMDVSDFYRPVVSLFEAEIALNSRKNWSAGDGWTAEYRNFLHDEIGEESEVRTDVSLVTGKIRSLGVKNVVDDDTDPCTALSVYTAGDYFLGRTWKGLDDDGCGSESVVVQEGRTGIASQYKSEPVI